MTTLDSHAASQTAPQGLDSVDFYIRNGHRLHARGAGEGVAWMVGLLRTFVRR